MGDDGTFLANKTWHPRDLWQGLRLVTEDQPLGKVSGHGLSLVTDND